ncbi:MAG: ComEA family DNA-binding protein [Lachnospiraceae bacterium]|nr:ComEA family DNA-binding protein [Lachnospiraceae bacterium]
MKIKMAGRLILWMIGAGLIFSGCGSADTFFYGETLQGQEAFPDTDEEKEETMAADGIGAETVQKDAAMTTAETTETPEASEVTGNTDTSDAQGQAVYVQVCGAVAKPGVYRLSAGARVFEAVTLAGGLLDDAAPDAVNQAQKVTDGELIRIPTQTEWEQICEEGGADRLSQDGAGTGDVDPGSGSGEGLVDLNTADAALLMTLPGIGESKAEDIIRYRESNGPFNSIEDVKKVSGIKDGLFQKIKDKIRV